MNLRPRKSTLWLAAALSALATSDARAAKPAERSQAPIQLTAAQLKAAGRESRAVDPAAAMMSFRPIPAVKGDTVGPPEISTGDRVLLAQRQLAGDAAGKAVDMAANVFDAAAAPLLEAMQPSANPRVIVGGETWTRVLNTTALPFRSVCYIEATFPNGGVVVGTANFVGSRVLLTNSHLVFSSALGGWARWIRVVPGKNGSYEPFGSQYAFYYETPYEWGHGQEHNRDFDMAWIVLPDRTLFNRIGYTFGYRTMTDATLRTVDLNTAGYPAAKRGQQWREFVTTNQVVYPAQYRHYFDSLGGSSGSPMYLLSGGLRQVVGVNCAEVRSPPLFNIATRMTSRYFDVTQRLNSWYR